MFKKLYKEANDQIPINTELLEKLKNEAVSPKKKSFAAIYKYGFAAAALLIVTVSLNVLPTMQQNAAKETADTSINEKSTEKKAQKYSGFSVPSASDTPANTNVNPAYGESTQQQSADTASTLNEKNKTNADKNTAMPPVSTQTIPTEQSTPEESVQTTTDTTPRIHTTIEQNPYMQNSTAQSDESTNHITAAQDTETVQPSVIPESENDAGATDALPYSDEPEIISNISRASGGGSSKQSATVEPNSDEITSFSFSKEKCTVTDNTVFLSLSEYTAYFGFSDIYIPKGMKIVSGDSVMLSLDPETGDPDKKIHTVKYADAIGSIEITYNSDSSTEEEIITTVDGKSYGKDCLITTVPDGFKAYVVRNNKGYTITFTNLDKKAVYSVIDSIH